MRQFATGEDGTAFEVNDMCILKIDGERVGDAYGFGTMEKARREAELRNRHYLRTILGSAYQDSGRDTLIWKTYP